MECKEKTQVNLIIASITVADIFELNNKIPDNLNQHRKEKLIMATLQNTEII